MLSLLLIALIPAEDPLRGAQLPAGDPIPDFRERPWVPPDPDPATQNKRGTDFGPAVAFTVQFGPNEFVRRGLTVRLPGGRAACYDTDRLALAATWKGGFLDVSKTHFEDEKGNLPGRPGGEVTRWAFDSPGWAGTLTYRSHFLSGPRTVLAYTVNGRNVWEMPGVDGDAVTRTFYVAPGKVALELNVGKGGPKVQLAGGAAWGVGEKIVVSASMDAISFKVALGGEAAPLIADLRHYLRGGEPRWREVLVTAGQLGPDDVAYTVDTLTLPEKNPWKSWLRPAAFDFFSDGRIAVSSMSGDLWVVSGIDAGLKQLKWKRFATGLYEPLGVRVVRDEVYVLGRDRITRLLDIDRDGEADFYENFFSGGTTSPGYHAFSFDLQTDSKGNFYFVKSGRKADEGKDHNALIRVSPDGTKWDAIATGFRHPNGMGVGPDDSIYVSDNQGEFVPASKVSRIREGGFYGYGTKVGPYEQPLFWLPMSEDNSAGGQLWAGPKWGPLAGKMLHTSYGTCKLFTVLPQGDTSASVVPFDFRFPSGGMRGRVNPIDGQVYVSGLRGWGTTGKADGCLSRVRYTGRPALLIENFEVVPTGLRLTVTEPLMPPVPADFRLEQWNYLYSEKYGSPEFSVVDPKKVGHDELTVKRVTISDDGRTVTLVVPDIGPVDQLKTAVHIRSRDGRQLKTNVFTTIRRMPK